MTGMLRYIPTVFYWLKEALNLNHYNILVSFFLGVVATIGIIGILLWLPPFNFLDDLLDQQQQIKEVEDNLESLSKRNVSLNVQIQSKNDEIQTLKDEMEYLRNQQKDHEQIVENIQEDLNSYRSKLRECKDRLNQPKNNTDKSEEENRIENYNPNWYP